MATGKGNKLTGQIGEHLVTAELGRRGIIATPFSGNVPDIDILAYANGKTAHIQVKAITKGDWQFNIAKFLDVEIVEDSQEQKVIGKNKELDPEIICVFVALGNKLGEDEFYIFKWGDLQKYAENDFKPRKHPQNFKSLHWAISKKAVSEYLDEKWDLIEEYFEKKETDKE
jgi:hypothetical protein